MDILNTRTVIAPSLITITRRAISSVTDAPRKFAYKLAHLKVFKPLVLSSTKTAVSRQNTISKSSTNTLPLSLGNSTPRPERPGIAGGCHPGLLWFRADLRLHDNEALCNATSECSSVLPVYCFDPRDYGRSPQGYDRTGPYRASFLIQAIHDLRQRLRGAGSDLIVRIGKPEEVLVDLARRIGAAAVYCHTEVTYEERQVERSVADALRGVGAKVNAFWTNTLHHSEDLPFALKDLPQHFDRFRGSVKSVSPRASMNQPETLKGLPLGGSISPGEVPTLEELGLQPLSSMPSALLTTAQQHGSNSKNNNNINNDNNNMAENGANECVGGESEALKRLGAFLQSSAEKRSRSVGAARTSNFSNDIAPWLATGCLSPRRMMEDAQRVLSSAATAVAAGIAAIPMKTEGGRGCSSADELQWIHFELLWRDFFRFLTRRHTEVVLPRARAAIVSSSEHQASAVV